MKITSSTSSTSIIGVMFMSDCARNFVGFMRHLPRQYEQVRQRSLKVTVTVMITGTGTPFSSDGV